MQDYWTLVQYGGDRVFACESFRRGWGRSGEKSESLIRILSPAELVEALNTLLAVFKFLSRSPCNRLTRYTLSTSVDT